MAESSIYRIVVEARAERGGYTYVITRADDPVWSQRTNIYYPTPEAASEAGRIALSSLLSRQEAKRAPR
jgi:hypothetical protein